MSKIVAILGSPKDIRSSTTGKMIQEFVEALKKSNSSIQSEIISLGGEILPCKACMTCQKRGKCIIEDGMTSLKESMRNADLLIFASPVHFNHVSSLFQNFIERSLIDLHTFEYVGKPLVNIVTTNGSGEEEAEKYLDKIGILFGAVKIGSIKVIQNDRFDSKSFEALVRNAGEILQGRKKLKPTLMNKLYFMSMKKVIKDNPKYFEYESKVWVERGWFDMDYDKVFATRAESRKPV